MKNKTGFTLAETLIAVSIFATVAVVAGGVFVSIVHEEKKSIVQSVIYEDLKIILQQITYEIQHGTIDYDEYYNHYVIQDGKDPEATSYGINYGVYGSRFYNPGQSFQSRLLGTTNPADLGSECSYPSPIGPGEKCEIVYSLSGDTNTGQNPYYGEPNSANAFCDNGQGKCVDPIGETDQLFLLDETGTRKTIIVKKLISINADEEKNDSAVGLVRMDGKDLDQNGVVDTFSCSEGFGCYEVEGKGITAPRKRDKDVEFLNVDGTINNSELSSFVPISPLRTNVQNLKFIINPLEDPYKAYAEPLVQSHPTVTIMMTLGLSKAAQADYPGDFDPITVQTTVAAGVVGRIDSYPPITEIKGDLGGDVWEQSWIDKIDPAIPETPR